MMSKWYSQRRLTGAELMPVDGLQSLDQWKSAFNNPSGGKVLTYETYAALVNAQSA